LAKDLPKTAEVSLALTWFFTGILAEKPCECKEADTFAAGPSPKAAQDDSSQRVIVFLPRPIIEGSRNQSFIAGHA
jgi:hypothetical protein